MLLPLSGYVLGHMLHHSPALYSVVRVVHRQQREAVRPCPRCEGHCWLPVLWLRRRNGRRCAGTGHVFRLSSRIW